jgi:hypothetical protein
MRDNDLYFIRWTCKHDGTVWKQLYNEEPVQVDETRQEPEVTKPTQTQPNLPKPAIKQLTCKRCNAS